MGVGSIFRDWDTLWNNEPLVGNTDTVEPRVVSFDYALRGLEGKRERCVPKDQMSCSELAVSLVYVHLGLQDSI